MNVGESYGGHKEVKGATIRRRFIFPFLFYSKMTIVFKWPHKKNETIN